MKEKIDVSVVIPSYNSELNLDTCLVALANQKTTCNFEVIVVDSSSHDLVGNICKHHSGVVFEKRNEQTSPGVGRNIGTKKSKGDILVFMDSDVILDKNAIEYIWASYNEGFKVFGGALELHKDYRLKLSAVLEHCFFNHESQKSRNCCVRKNLSSALLIFEKKMFVDLNGFKDIPRMQDTELTERVISKGVALYLQPKIVGYQIQDSNIIKVLKKIYINGFNLYGIRYKNKITSMKKLSLVVTLPLISFAKVTRIIARNLIYNDFLGKLWTVLLIPGFYFCGVLWMVGFYSSIVGKADMYDGR